MSTLTRVNKPQYKEYVNFLSNYKGSKNDELHSVHSTDSGISIKSFPLSTESSNNSSNSSLNSDVVDYQKTSGTPFNDYLENYKNKKFNPVKPKLDKLNSNDCCNNKQNKTVKTEIYIEIQNPVSEISKVFEKPSSQSQEKNVEEKKNNGISEKIRMFQGNDQSNKSSPPKYIAPKQPTSFTETKHNNTIRINRTVSSSPVQEERKPEFSTIKTVQLLNCNQIQNEKVQLSSSSSSTSSSSSSVENLQNSDQFANVPPPPPMMPPTAMFPTRTTVNKPALSTKPPTNQKQMMTQNQIPVQSNGQNQNTIDRNNPVIKKLVYGALREMYRANHDKANDIVSTLPRNAVKKDNNIQNIIDNIAARGDLDKLNGRANPKLEQE